MVKTQTAHTINMAAKLEGSMLFTSKHKGMDTIITIKQGRNTLTKYCRNESLIRGLTTNSLVMKATIQTNKWTKYTDSGDAPNLSTIYDIGTMESNIPPMSD